MIQWNEHICKVGEFDGSYDDTELPDDPLALRKKIEPWLTAIFQSEYLSVLLGSGFTIGVAASDEITAGGMGPVEFGSNYDDAINQHAEQISQLSGRGSPNIEDQIISALSLIEGLRVLNDENVESLSNSVNQALARFLERILETETQIENSLKSSESSGMTILLGFLLSFASRAAPRERVNILTTNYDRLIEYACDRLGIRILDRFVGQLEPEFRSSRQLVDLHYNPPGIRGEPRYLEGIVRLTKLHGSIDWQTENSRIIRNPLPFGADSNHSEFPSDPLNRTLIYPNPAKEIESFFFPYAELFRDYATATCRPNSSLVTYGYGFGDAHINRVIRDMLTIPSTHLVIISWGQAEGRIKAFYESVGRPSQISLLIGEHFGDIGNWSNFIYRNRPLIS